MSKIDKTCNLYDYVTNPVPNTDFNDIKHLFSTSSGFHRFIALWPFYIVSIILVLLFIISAWYGYNSTWYTNLKHTRESRVLLDVLWVVVILISYGSTYFLWENIPGDHANDDKRIINIFIITSFLNLLWGVVFFQGENIGLAFWLIALTFIYQFWVLSYFTFINFKAGIFLIPLQIMYGYLLWSTGHLAYLNGVPL